MRKSLCLLTALILLPVLARATTVTQIASVTQSGGSCTLTAASGVAATHLVVIASIDNAASLTFVTAVADSASNTYNVIDVASDNTSDGVGVITSSGYMATAIASGGTITVTTSGQGCIAYDVSVGAASSWLDKTASLDNSFSVTQLTGTTATTAHSPNVNIGVFGGGSSCAATVTWSGTWTGLTNTLVNSSRCLTVGWQEVVSTGAQSGTITLSAADDDAGEIASYSEGGVGPSPASKMASPARMAGPAKMN